MSKNYSNDHEKSIWVSPKKWWGKRNNNEAIKGSNHKKSYQKVWIREKSKRKIASSNDSSLWSLAHQKALKLKGTWAE